MALIWTDQNSTSTIGLGTICWSPDLGILCGGGGSPAGSRFVTSPDGVTWTGFASGGAGGGFNTGLVWDGAQFVALGSQATNQCIQTSPDGQVWTQQTAQQRLGPGSWSGMTYSPGLDLLVAVGTNDVMTSADGITWAHQTVPSNNGWRCVAWSPALGIFCAVGTSTHATNVMTSTDGVTWNGTAVAFTGRQWRDICWSPDLALFVAVDGSNDFNGNVGTSPDGTTWTLRTTPSGRWQGVCWSPERQELAAVSNNNGSGGTGAGFRAMTSPDGIVWTANATTSDISWNDVCWSDDLGSYCAVSTTGNLLNVMTGANALVLDAIAPARGTKRGGTVCTLTGSGLDGVSTVTFDGVAATDIVPAADGLSLTCINPAHAVGPIDVDIA